MSTSQSKICFIWESNTATITDATSAIHGILPIVVYAAAAISDKVAYATVTGEVRAVLSRFWIISIPSKIEWRGQWMNKYDTQPWGQGRGWRGQQGRRWEDKDGEIQDKGEDMVPDENEDKDEDE